MNGGRPTTVAFVVVVAVVLFSSLLPACSVESEAALEYSTPDDEMVSRVTTPASTSCYYYSGYHDVYCSSSSGNWGGHWSDLGCWVYVCKISAIASSTGGGGWYNDGMIRATAFEIQAVSNAGAMTVTPVNSTEYDYCYPSAGAADDLSGVSTLLVSLAMSTVSSLGASLSWALASELISSLGTSAPESILDDGYVWRLWGWDADVEECHQHLFYWVTVDPGETVVYSTNYYVFGPGFELLAPATAYFSITAPSSSTASDPAEVTEEERAELGIETVSREALSDYAAENGVDDSTVESMMSSDSDEFYFVSGDSDGISVQQGQSADGGGLMGGASASCDADAAMERSRVLVRAFSSECIRDREGSAEIVEKYASLMEATGAGSSGQP